MTYRIERHLRRTVLLVQLLLPAAFVAQSSAQSPGRVYLSDDRERIRHPEEKKLRRLTVIGKDYRNFDPEREIIRLQGMAGHITVQAYY